MTPSRLMEALAMIVEGTCYRVYDRTSGDEQPITNEQWDLLSDRFLMLCAKNRTQEESRERTIAGV